ncbi:MAG: DNA-processing protein DprA [Devosiaceae bacterium]
MSQGQFSLTDGQRLDWLQLIRTPQVGPALFQDLINHFGSAASALDALPDMAARRGKPLRPIARADAEAEMQGAHKIGARFVVTGEPGYPVLLNHTSRPPPMLCALMRDEQIAQKTGIGIVGARNASAGGLSLARAMAQALGNQGYATLSGLARGIDAAVHLGSLKFGTVAFVAGGLARPYPPEHGDLMHQIANEGGAVYSEMPLNWVARAQDFPKRNRLVAGSSLGLIVVEAAKRSGSLITARQALEIGREVMAVPGFPMDPRSDGPNSLIRDGARLVRDADDVIAELRPLEGKTDYLAHQSKPQGDLLQEAQDLPFEHQLTDQDADSALNAAMGFSPVEADTLIATTGVPTHLVRGWLLENELAGAIVRSSGDRFAWNPERAI